MAVTCREMLKQLRDPRSHQLRVSTASFCAATPALLALGTGDCRQLSLDRLRSLRLDVLEESGHLPQRLADRLLSCLGRTLKAAKCNGALPLQELSLRLASFANNAEPLRPSSEARSALMEGLESLPLRRLQLSFLPLRQKDVSEKVEDAGGGRCLTFTSMLRGLGRLEHLVLTHNGMFGDVAMELAKALQQLHLRTADFSRNRISVEAQSNHDLVPAVIKVDFAGPGSRRRMHPDILESQGLLHAAAASKLEDAFQSVLTGLSKKYGFATQLAWKSATEDFTVSAGRDPVTGRAVTENDTFAFGSGTKPYTAVLVLKLVAEGKVELDKPAATYVDGVLQRLNGTSMVGLFGQQASQVTVGHLLRMQSGLNDFDVPDFDKALLQHGDTLHSPMEFLHGAAKQSPVFLCDPGACTSYTSTNYILAGFVALGASGGTDWSALDQSQIFPKSAGGKYQQCTFADKGQLNSSLTIAGASGGFFRHTRVSSQDASILGWTCGNLVSPASAAAEFFYDLLIAKQIIPAKMVDEMQDWRPLNVGWAKGQIQYGTGLMIQQTSWNATYPPVLGSWGSYVGHGGDTYGFLSESGVLPQFNASFSAIANQDYMGTFVKNLVVCSIIEVAAKVILDEEIYLKCGIQPFPTEVVV
ncbi:unnamed protein product [Symbiodinium sp. CCMP2592]|nr:unnamed protein product [Symbiodinium sp. CCMP2592]